MRLTHEHQSRRHPHRLPPSDYRVLWQPVCFTVNVHRRRCVLLDAARPELILDSLQRNAEASACAVIAYCIMPDHVHVVACVSGEQGDLIPFIEGFKRDSGYALSCSGVGTPVWQRSYWDRGVRKQESLGKIVDYVLANPVRRGLCERPEDWLHSAFLRYPWER